MFEATGSATIARPERWVKQLCSHFANKTSVEDVSGGHVIHFTAGDGIVTAGDGEVLFVAQAETAEQLVGVQDVLARHFERFAQREEVTVVWAEGGEK